MSGGNLPPSPQVAVVLGDTTLPAIFLPPRSSGNDPVARYSPLDGIHPKSHSASYCGNGILGYKEDGVRSGGFATVGRVFAQSKVSNRVRSERKQHHDSDDVPRESGFPLQRPGPGESSTRKDPIGPLFATTTNPVPTMDYVVLARKLRPTRFADLIGQEMVVRALLGAVRTERIAHAFLFTGSRGVGKTSTARILTKAINCEAPQDGEPCNACGNCTEIARNASPDVYEIDAASNRGIDNIRELRENTGYVPVNCTYKTYIIDEVHMLTTESFNALLKTLEEPPPHVKFILATTSPHRIPDTILSRCQRFDFARIPVAELADYLEQVTRNESIALSRPALEAIARNAEGGVRDALTAVDQVVAFSGGEASDDEVRRILGLADHGEIAALLKAILDKSLPEALEAFTLARAHGHDLTVLLEALIREVKDFSLFQSLDGAGAEARLVLGDRLPESLALFEARKDTVTLDELQQLFYLLLEVEGQLKRSEFAQGCFEMGLVKACRVQRLVGVPEMLLHARRLTGGGTGGQANFPPPSAGHPASGTAQPPSAPPASRAQSLRPPQSTPAPPPPPQGREREGGARESTPSADPRGEEAEPASHADAGSAPSQSPSPEPSRDIAPRATVPEETVPEETAPKATAPPSPAPRENPPPFGGSLPPEPPLSAEEPLPPEPPPSSEEPLPPEPPNFEGDSPWVEGPDAPPGPGQDRAQAMDAGLESTPEDLSAAPPPGAPVEKAPGEARSQQSQSKEAQTQEPPTRELQSEKAQSRESQSEESQSEEALSAGPLEPALCDDARWRVLVERADALGKKLGANLRRSEVAALAPEGIVLIAPDSAGRLSSEDIAVLGPLAAEIFAPDASPQDQPGGPNPFPIRQDDDTKKSARPTHTIAGRNRIEELNTLAARRGAAEQDEKVQRLLRAFPNAKVVDITLSDTSNRSEDV